MSLGATFGVDGSGVTLGVLSDSYDNLGGAATDVASGDLPGPDNPEGNTIPVNVLEDLPSGGIDEVVPCCNWSTMWLLEPSWRLIQPPWVRLVSLTALLTWQTWLEPTSLWTTLFTLPSRCSRTASLPRRPIR